MNDLVFKVLKDNITTGDGISSIIQLTPDIYNEIAKDEQLCMLIFTYRTGNSYGYMDNARYLELKEELDGLKQTLLKKLPEIVSCIRNLA